jgi:hypothetical protein
MVLPSFSRGLDGFTLSTRAWCNAMVVGGYPFFIRFIRGEGERTVRLQTRSSRRTFTPALFQTWR